LVCFFISLALVIFEVEAESLTALIAIQFRAEPGTILTRRFEQRPHFG